MPFEFMDPEQTKLTLRVEGPKSFSVVHGFHYRDQYDEEAPYSVPDQFGPTDLASVPFFLQWLVLSYGKHTMAALVHDVYWDNDKTQAELRRANTAFRHAMWESDVPYVRRWFMWTAVTLGMLTKSGIGRLRVGLWALALLTATAAPLAAHDIVLSWQVPARVALAAGLLAAGAVVAWALGSKAIAGISRRVVTGLIGLLVVMTVFSLVGHVDWVADHGWLVAAVALVVGILAWGKLIAAGIFATIEVVIILLPLLAIVFGLLLYGALEVAMLGLLKLGRAIKGKSGKKPIGTLNPVASDNLQAPPPAPDARLKASQV